LLKIKLDILLRKIGASPNFKIELGSLHISPELGQTTRAVGAKSFPLREEFSRTLD
jgi:hypothetical protein